MRFGLLAVVPFLNIAWLISSFFISALFSGFAVGYFEIQYHERFPKFTRGWGNYVAMVGCSGLILAALFVLCAIPCKRKSQRKLRLKDPIHMYLPAGVWTVKQHRGYSKFM